MTQILRLRFVKSTVGQLLHTQHLQDGWLMAQCSNHSDSGYLGWPWDVKMCEKCCSSREKSPKNLTFEEVSSFVIGDPNSNKLKTLEITKRGWDFDFRLLFGCSGYLGYCEINQKHALFISNFSRFRWPLVTLLSARKSQGGLVQLEPLLRPPRHCWQRCDLTNCNGRKLPVWSGLCFVQHHDPRRNGQKSWISTIPCPQSFVVSVHCQELPYLASRVSCSTENSITFAVVKSSTIHGDGQNEATLELRRQWAAASRNWIHKGCPPRLGEKNRPFLGSVWARKL